MSVIFLPAILGRKWMRQFYGHLASFGSFCWKTPMPIKILVLGGLGCFWKGAGGGSANSIFMGVGMFPKKERFVETRRKFSPSCPLRRAMLFLLGLCFLGTNTRAETLRDKHALGIHLYDYSPPSLLLIFATPHWWHAFFL